MTTEILISGFGGQGALFAGQLLAEAAMQAGDHVTWLPSYGPEMRGGTAHCIVIISRELIGSPIVQNPRVVLALNQPSLDKYEPLIKAGGLMIWNESLIRSGPARSDLSAIPVPATEIASELGDQRMANVVMCGALLGALPLIETERFMAALKAVLPERRRHLVAPNREAVQRGLKIGMAYELAHSTQEGGR